MNPSPSQKCNHPSSPPDGVILFGSPFFEALGDKAPEHFYSKGLKDGAITTLVPKILFPPGALTSITDWIPKEQIRQKKEAALNHWRWCVKYPAMAFGAVALGVACKFRKTICGEDCGNCTSCADRVCDRVCCLGDGGECDLET